MAVYGERLDCRKSPETDPSYTRALNVLIDFLDRITDAPLTYQVAWNEHDDAPVLGPDPFFWNDRPSRTIDEVVTTLKAAADDWHRQHPGGVR
jgi:hypothetical protein